MANPDQPPRSILSGRFSVVRRLGMGGMGVVYEVMDAEHAARLALKELPSLTADTLLRFKNEFRTLQGISHPNLVSLGELFEDHGKWFFTMELVDGQDFMSWVRALPRGAVNGINRSAVTQSGSSPSGTRHDDSTAKVTVLKRPDPASRPSPSPVPQHVSFDEQRLRAGLVQLADALDVLHRADKIHCDLKPANILVTEHGRLVLLDFGLAGDIGKRLTVDANPTQVVGTPTYMSPEHAAGHALSAATDWYSFGVLLYEALTGTRPFGGHSREVLRLKQQFRPLAIHELNAEAPEDLATLCDELLQLDPSRRPSGAEVRSRLRARHPQAPPRRSAAFVGRERELATLMDTFAQVVDGDSAAVIIEGVPGIGKTALSSQLVHRIATTSAAAVVIRGRCYEREAVPYKAYDAAMDELAQHLMAQPLKDLPSAARVLAQAFPVLWQVPGLESAEGQQPPVDSSDLRDRLLTGLRAVLDAIGTSRPVVMLLDDAQWSDADSLALTAALVRDPMPRRLMLIATVRAPAEPRVLEAFGENAQRLALSELDADEARALAREVLPVDSAGLAADIASESAGHPLFIEELGRHVALHRQAVTSGLQLDAAMRARVAELEAADQRLLQLLAVHSAPLRHDVVALAAGLTFGEYDQRAQRLRAEQFTRGAGARRTDAIELLHDRVREAIHASLSATAISGLHRALAGAFERCSPGSHETLAVHWHGGGEPERAAHHALLGARQAHELLAYAHEAKLLRMALELAPRRRPEACAIHRSLADALVRDGRAAEGGREYLAAARLATPVDALDLERLAAEYLLRSGHVEEGMALLRHVTSAVGLKMPERLNAIIASLVWNRLRLKVRGFKFREVPDRDVPVETLRRIDTCWSAATGLVLIETATAWLFQARGMLLALDAGEPQRVGRALALEIALGTHMGGRTFEASEAIAEQAYAVSDRVKDPHIRGLANGMLGVAAFERGMFERAIREFEKADRILSEQCSGVDLELTSIRLFANRARAQAGHWVELSRCIPEYIRQANARGDRLSAAVLSMTYCSFAWLATDAPDQARHALEEGMKHWRRAQGTHIEHGMAWFADLHIDLYEGAHEQAYRRMEEGWPMILSGALMRSQTARNANYSLRAMCAAAAANSVGVDQRRRIIRESVRHLSKSKLPNFRARGLQLRAVLALLEGDRDEARRLLQSAADTFAHAEMRIYECAVRYRLAQWDEGEKRAAALASTEQTMRALGAHNPAAVVRMLAPGLD